MANSAAAGFQRIPVPDGLPASMKAYVRRVNDTLEEIVTKMNGYMPYKSLSTAAQNTITTETQRIVNSVIDNLVVGEAKIDDLAVSSAKIQDLAVTTAKIALLAVTEAQIANLSITNGKIGNLAVDTAKIALGSITQALIASGAVGTLQIDDGSITDAKIVDLTANKINAGTLSVERLIVVGTNQSIVYTINEANGTAQLSATTIDGGSLTQRSITADRIVAGSITANEIAAATILANNIAAGTITGDNIAASTIKATNIDIGNLVAATAFINALKARGVEIGADGATVYVKIENGQISFVDTGEVVAYITGQVMHITSIEVDSIKIGGVTLVKTANGFSIK